MPAKRYIVTLTAEERQSLDKLTKTEKSASQIRHAHILLKADVNDDGWKDKAIKEAFNISIRTIERVRQRFVEEGLENALKPRPSHTQRQQRIDGEAEAHLIALACSSPPEGYCRWTLRLLAEQIVQLGHLESISHESVRQALKKTSLSLG